MEDLEEVEVAEEVEEEEEVEEVRWCRWWRGETAGTCCSSGLILRSSLRTTGSEAGRLTLAHSGSLSIIRSHSRLSLEERTLPPIS